MNSVSEMQNRLTCKTSRQEFKPDVQIVIDNFRKQMSELKKKTDANESMFLTGSVCPVPQCKQYHRIES
ncbi:hypothetical protein PBCVNY2B_471L [Paramecium bursaria Chlorella virus NY2B]|uniref:hypothetical protein n=1 Tax=Paramecium bursaria Chlorella virus AR158 TaxID=380598 RepID=UPI00015AA6C3|nr:hypothetical protein AR158_c411L [Paramecium bursaria Chlorella virus AR158]ABU43956.1 hypothetical protein AR158_c411L [Paramecium bursaria Chlorella virus AR158]AGE54250.1 hypothetical protein PBCVIL52s1_490L [Paramecium bursaria Chlorella virus IL-5-2s1]AGE54890.1 hypothetical protein PBCVMA1D_353L [Paramecium bursaria Chlorella virus MA1D]AGE58365.1 hypothetical protein PBCVNY2B_471L [Paramecium bursaria Chlorella virus NY2B]